MARISHLNYTGPNNDFSSFNGPNHSVFHKLDSEQCQITAIQILNFLGAVVPQKIFSKSFPSCMQVILAPPFPQFE
jgi:hypothetical protein